MLLPFVLDVDNGIWRAWWVEPLIASLSFAFWIHVYWYNERKLGLSRNNRLWDTIGVTSRGDLYNSFIGYWIGVVLFKGCRKLVRSLSTAVEDVETDSSMTHTIPDGIPVSYQDLVFLTTEVVWGIILYDAFFFLIHWMMHEIPSFRRVHARHHQNYPINHRSTSVAPMETSTKGHHQDRGQKMARLEARDVLRHSLLDGSLQVLCNILVQQWTFLPLSYNHPKSRMARILHNILVTWILTESHTSSPTPNVWRRFFVGVREHREHHDHPLVVLEKRHNIGPTRRSQSYYPRYQQFFGYLDDARRLWCAR